MRELMEIFADIPLEFILVGLIVSVYHGYRGYVLQRWTEQTQKHESGQTAKSKSTNFVWFMSKTETVVVRYVYDFLFYSFCSIVGFAALWLAISIVDVLPSIHDISGAVGGLLAFLVVLAVLGIGGILPSVIQLGKFPK
jgi:hypothetical protein